MGRIWISSALPAALLAAFYLTASAAEIEVRPGGEVSSLNDAQHAARKSKAAAVVLHRGTYYLTAPLIFTAEDNGTEYRAAPGETVIISGGAKLDLHWQPYKTGIMQAKTPPGLVIDQLFVNGRRQIMARYPNYDPKSMEPYGGSSASAFSRQRAAHWADPAGGYIHAMHAALWGGYSYRITGKNDRGDVTYEGGWQNNRQMGMHEKFRYVENIFEELDSPGEWFHNAKTGTLYYYPPPGVDIRTAVVEAVRLRNLVTFEGAKNVTLRGFIFRHAARTFMDTREPLLRSDWTIYRGGAVVFSRAENCSVEDCEFDQLGGNGVFVNGYNRRIRIAGCDIHDTGGSGVAFVGDPSAVRNPLFEFGQRQNYSSIDKTPGPKTDDYPADCILEDCLIRHAGVVEKQAAGVEIAMSSGITLRHCSIYDTSRAGINIGDGCWGGNVIEYCDVFDTVKETGDHGSFNSWGRDRYWALAGAPAGELPRLALLDTVMPNVIRNNRWRCDRGWDVDLDDGSSNYEIYNNLFLHGGLKLREGFHRHVWNNIAVGNSLHPHVWFDDSGDIVERNIWMGPYQPAGGMPRGRWGKRIDRNLFTSSDLDRLRFAANDCDIHSLVGDARFVDAASGDYCVKEGSPALTLGFKNFPMDHFGVEKPALKAIARTPELPKVGGVRLARSSAVHDWRGGKVKDLAGEEYSAFGVSKDSGGVEVVVATSDGLRAGDLIQSINGQPVKNCADLLRLQKAANGKAIELGIIRDQKPKMVRLAD